MSKNLVQKISKIQKCLSESQIEGWLIYDCKGSNPIAYELLDIPKTELLTRRFFYWIPLKGEPIALMSRVEAGCLEHLPGKKLFFSSWISLEKQLKELLSNKKRIAMEYSSNAALPTLSLVDAGTLEQVKRCGVDVCSSADFIAHLLSVWNAMQLKNHRDAAKVVQDSVAQAWESIHLAIKKGKTITEWEVQQSILEQFCVAGCHTDSGPICAVNAHSADPHYIAKKDTAAPIKKGDFVLIDLWCKKNAPQATYADICRVALVGSDPTPRQQRVFDTVLKAQKRAIALIKERMASGKRIEGWEADAAARQVIEEAGFGAEFVHRLGHNIGEEDHGNGTHLDNYETQDKRALLKQTCFSVEPGIYLPGEFGVRLETNLFIHSNGTLEITGGLQEEFLVL